MLNGIIKINGDKSISHRVLMFAAISEEECIIKNLSNCTDVKRTLQILKDCGIKINQSKDSILIIGLHPLHSKKKRFFCGNSGTTARLMLGFLPSRGISGTLYGDKSLSQRPMKRIIQPLREMNISINSQKQTLPIKFKASNIKSINHTLSVPSAQVKTSLIFAALSSINKSIIKDPFKTRDHTERLITFLGYKKNYFNKFNIKGFNYVVPGDISSASYLVAAALLVPNSNITIQNVLFNKTRSGYIDSLQKMGGRISIKNKTILQNETICDINIKYTEKLSAIKITKNHIVTMIDEIPIFALICAHATGTSIIEGAEELRYKESDRIHAIVHNFKKLKINIKELNDGFSIKGPNTLYNTSISTFKDHRIALVGEIINIIKNKPLSNKSTTKALIKTSFPEFYDIIGEINE